MLLNRNSNGYFGYCEDCEEYHLMFNNLFMAFSENKLNNFDKEMFFLSMREFKKIFFKIF